MSISTTTGKWVQTMDAGTTDYAYPYAFYAKSEMTVTIQEIATGNTTLLALGIGYTIAATAPYPTGTTITLVDPKTSAWKVIFQRVLPLTQLTEWPESGPFPALSHETALDRLTMIMQQIQDKAERLLLTNITETSGYGLPIPEAYYYIGWNADADAIINYPPVSANAVGVSAAAAAGYAITAQGYATAAGISAAAAAVSAADAATSAANAKISEDAAQVSEDLTIAKVALIFKVPPPTLHVTWSIGTLGSYAVDAAHYSWDVLNHYYIGANINTDDNRYFIPGKGEIGSITLYTMSTTTGNSEWSIYAHQATGCTMVFKICPMDFLDENTIYWASSPKSNLALEVFHTWLYIDKSGYVRLKVISDDAGGGYKTNIVSSSPITAGVETTIIVTIEPLVAATIWINGVSAATGMGHIDSDPGPGPLHHDTETFLGYTVAPSPLTLGVFSGYIRPIRMYDRILTSGEIAAITTSGNTYPASGLVGHLDYTDISVIPAVKDIVSTDYCLCSFPVGYDETTCVYRDGVLLTQSYY